MIETVVKDLDTISMELVLREDTDKKSDFLVVGPLRSPPPPNEIMVHATFLLVLE